MIPMQIAFFAMLLSLSASDEPHREASRWGCCKRDKPVCARAMAACRRFGTELPAMPRGCSVAEAVRAARGGPAINGQSIHCLRKVEV